MKNEKLLNRIKELENEKEILEIQVCALTIELKNIKKIITDLNNSLDKV